MDPFHSEPSSSVLSLVKRLAGERWVSVYERLLDVSGKHRYGTVQCSVQEHLTDIISEFRIVGNTSDASNIQRLSGSLCTSDQHADALLVLLLCAKMTRENPRNFPQFPDARLEYADKSSTVTTRARAFTFDESSDQALQKREHFMLLSKEEEASHPSDCIADTARCEHESYSLWLCHNLAEEHNRDTATFANRLDLDASTNPLPATTKSKLEETQCMEGFDGVQHRLEMEDVQAPQQVSERCKSVLHQVFHMCIVGPNVDDQSDYDASPRPTLLFKASTAEATIASVEKSRAFARRRKFTKELKAWIQRLQRNPNRRNISTSRTRALMCGLIYQSVISFGPVYISQDSSKALKAVVSYVMMRADSYVGAILKLADPTCADPAALDLIMLDTAESFSAQLREIGSVLECIEETDGSSESIINALSSHLRRSPCSTSLQDFFLHVMRSYEKALRDWVMEGSCVREESISTAEFTEPSTDVTSLALNLTGRVSQTETMVSAPERSALFSENQALFLRRAGLGRAIHRILMMDDPSLVPASQEMYPTEEGQQQHDKLRISTETSGDQPARISLAPGTMTCVFTDSLDKSWNNTQVMQNYSETHLSSYFALDEELSIDGGSIHSDSAGKKKLTPDNASWEFGSFNDAVYPTLYAEGTIARFRKVDENVQRKIFESFEKDMEVFAHLEFIRKYILLGAGDFANALVEQINSASLASESSEIFLSNRKKAALTFYGSADAGKRQVRSLLHLKRCFRTALYLFNNDTERFAAHLKLELSSSLGETESTSELWDHQIDFVYEVPDPLKLIISTEAMSVYSKIHAFFLRVHRAKMSLRNLFMITRRQSVLNNMPLLSLLRNRKIRSMLWLFCMDSEQFVNTIGGFFMDQVIGSAWQSFKCLWTSCESVWALQDAHRRFLEGSMQRCLLDPRQKNLRNVISGGFDIIHNVEKEMTKLHESSTLVKVDVKTLQDLISSASASLRRRAVFLSDVLERLSEAGTWHATSIVAWW